MADVNAVVMIAGEVRQVENKRDFTDKETGEFREGKGRKAKILTTGGFIDLSIPQEADEVAFVEGSTIFAFAAVVPWSFPARVNAQGVTTRRAQSGTAFVYEGRVTAADLEVLPVAELA